MAEVTSPPGPSLGLAPVFPNPSTGRTSFRFYLPNRGPASLRIYDLAGRFVFSAVEQPFNAGVHEVTWNRQVGVPVAPGVYFAELRTAYGRSSRRIVIVH